MLTSTTTANPDFEALLGECHSSTEQMLTLAAWQLWDGGRPARQGPSLRELVVYLDEDQFEALVESMRLHRDRH